MVEYVQDKTACTHCKRAAIVVATRVVQPTVLDAGGKTYLDYLCYSCYEKKYRGRVDAEVRRRHYIGTYARLISALEHRREFMAEDSRLGTIYSIAKTGNALSPSDLRYAWGALKDMEDSAVHGRVNAK